MSNAPRTARALARAELTRAILDRAGRQLAEVGPAALSVRQVARDLGMASSAVYRYFPSRDALLTALIIEGYDDLASAMESADAAVPREDLTGRWAAVSGSIRDWALTQPHRYALLYGSPVPGYAAPDDTVAPAARITMALLRIAADAQAAGLRPPATLPLTGAAAASLAPVRAFVEPNLDEDVALRAALVWATLFGTISLELFGHMYRGILDYEAHFDQLVRQLAADLGLGDAG